MLCLATLASCIHSYWTRRGPGSAAALSGAGGGTAASSCPEPSRLLSRAHGSRVPSLSLPEQTTSGELHFEIRKAGALHGFTAWFSVRFQSPEEDEPQLVLSTGPFHP